MGKVQVLLTTRSGRRFYSLAGELEGLLEETARGLTADAELIMQANAPKAKTGPARLARGIVSRPSARGEFVVVSTARDPETGYPYTGVTRFGHRKEWITPTRRARATVINTKRARGRGKRANLRFVVGGPNGLVLYRRKVKGVVRNVDWVDTAMPEVKAEASIAMHRLGKVITARMDV